MTSSRLAVVRMENPVLESENKDNGAVNCSGSLSLDLPPGVTVVGGRRTLTADVDYSIQPAADGSGDVVLLRNADPIIAPLATLARAAQPIVQPAAPAESNGVAPAGPPVTAPTTPPSAPAPGSSARPSFDCANARTSGEVAVCADSTLSSMDCADGEPVSQRAGSGDAGAARAAAIDPRPLPGLARPLPRPGVHRRHLLGPDARDPRHHGRPLAAAAISRG